MEINSALYTRISLLGRKKLHLLNSRKAVSSELPKRKEKASELTNELYGALFKAQLLLRMQLQCIETSSFILTILFYLGLGYMETVA